jgi:hypothetical protein
MPRLTKEMKENIKMIMDDKITGGAIPHQTLVEHASRFKGGSICHICMGKIDECCMEDEMKGEGILTKASEKIESLSRKGASKVKKAGKKTGKYVTSETGLAEDLVDVGVPTVSAALLGAPTTAVAGPVAGLVASAAGRQLGKLAAKKIDKEIEGSGTKRKSRFVKGSEEAREYMRMLREKRLSKKTE